MSMVDKDVVLPRLQKLDEILRELKRFGKFSQSEFVKDKVVRGYIERNLELAAETIIDIGNHFIAFYRWPRPDTYKGVFEVLANEKVISKTLASKLADIASFRNVLVHFYLKLDPLKVFKHLKNDPKPLKAFSQSVYQFMKKYGIV